METDLSLIGWQEQKEGRQSARIKNSSATNLLCQAKLIRGVLVGRLLTLLLGLSIFESSSE